MKTILKMRMSNQDAHYGGNLVDGAKILGLFGDAATELLIRLDGDEGLFRAYESVDFLAPVYAGDFVEVEAEIIEAGNTSRRMEFFCYKVITARPDISTSACDALEERLLTTKAVGTCIVPKELQRYNG
ncbi:MAG: hotdog domain-containing protein [Candidatus Izemoplasmatales bacterium]|nr:hotdog domain-containing protein [Candidatus Izemoplasmatales bacterium]MDD4069752.1 hotdog domain-containing protein [Candidatus Izemoplasmatales bacterium]MDY0138666.1 hotdog domain-containing protein [Candidatus Izemoplasmatales bacterium]